MIGYVAPTKQYSLLIITDDVFQASLVDFIAFNCQAKQHAIGGTCLAKDSAWFVQ